MGSFSQIRVVPFWCFACSCERLNRKEEAVVAEVSGFKHISVSADSEDDVVIWAGTEQASAEACDSARAFNVAGTEGASAEAPDSAQTNQGASSEVRDSVQINQGAPDSAQFVKPASVEACDSAQINEVPDSAKPAPAPAPVKRTAQSDAKDQGYRETTLDDLKSEPMSKTQKIIIACAIAAVAAAIVYYFVFMR